MSDLSFVQNVAKGVDTLGVEFAPIIFSLARINWDSVEDRDSVLEYLGADG